MKIGVIGYGYWGPNLVRNFAELEGTQVKWCADKRQDRRALVKRRYPSINVTDDARHIFDDPEVNAVVIAAPVSASRNSSDTPAGSSVTPSSGATTEVVQEYSDWRETGGMKLPYKMLLKQNGSSMQ